MKKLVFIVLLFTTKTPWAKSSVDPQMADAIRKISHVRETLKFSSETSQACATPEVPTCTFENSCAQFSGKGQDFYLYKNSEGRQIPNFQMIHKLRFAETCLKQPFPQAAVADPFVYPELFIDAKRAGGSENLKQNQAQYKKEVQRAGKIFSDAKNRVLALLESRRTPGNTNEISNLIERIKVTQFAEIRLGKTHDLAEQGCEMPNAFFNPAKNVVSICPQFLTMPDAALFYIVAHELGHAVDPCQATNTYSKSPKGELTFHLPPYIDREEPPKNPALPILSPDRHPLKTVIACLKSPVSLGVKLPTQHELLRAVDQEEEALRKELAEYDGGELGDATLTQFEDQRTTIKKQYPLYQNCKNFSGTNHVEEAYSDWIATEIVSNKVSEFKTPAQARQYTFESMAPFLARDCENIKQSVHQRIQKATGSRCENYSDVVKVLDSHGGRQTPHHPPTANRMNRILLASPELKKALGCKGGSNAKECR